MIEQNLRLSDWLVLTPLALILYLTHMPGFGYLRIDALVLLVALFSLYRANGMPLFLAFLLGLMQDIVSLAPFGQHAIGLVSIAYVAQSFRDRIRMQGVFKQLPAIFLFLLTVKFIHSWVVALGFGHLPTLDSFISVVITTCVWPLLVHVSFVLTRDRRDRINRTAGYS